jgi:hypothetical protein
LQGLSIDAASLGVDNAAELVWKAVERLEVTESKATLVAGTKTLHHLLPELVPPMDREYTQRFFGWHNPQFQYGQEKCFRSAFGAFAFIAREVNPRQFVGTHAWNTSLTKVLDNALVGLMRASDDVRAVPVASRAATPVPVLRKRPVSEPPPPPTPVKPLSVDDLADLRRKLTDLLNSLDKRRPGELIGTRISGLSHGVYFLGPGAIR